MLLKIDHEGPTRIERATDSNGYRCAVSDGWNLIAVYQEDLVTKTWNSGGETRQSERVTFCVYGMPRDTALAEALEHKMLAESKAEKLTAEINVLEGAADAYRKEIERFKSASVLDRSMRLDAETKRAEIDKRAMRMESDIAKLRNALGELRMKEILGS